MFVILLIIKLIFLNSIEEVLCDDIFGCGGFVKSSFSINYSRVEIKLYTKQGSLKYQTDCAPHNGYYLIPLYDKGDYILKIEPPSGWIFEPNSVVLHVDGKSDPCSLQQDINFHFKGFSVSGQVLSRGGKTGPAGIKIFLKSSDNVLHETTTSVSGHYQFSELFPNNYTIEARHSVWIFDKASEEIKILNDNVKTENEIVISGYDVIGFVYSDGQPIQGVHFLLYSQKILGPILGCKAEKVKGFSQKMQVPYLCYVTSSQDGKFTFPSLPPGEYTLMPFYKGEHIEFDVSPSRFDFTVEEESLIIKENFQVQGFSVSGWIGTGPKGKSLPRVSVYINGFIHGSTDINGIYHLENMRAGEYNLDFKKNLYVFESKEMKINPNTPRLPDIYVSKYSICGQIFIDEFPVEKKQEEKQNLVLKSLKNKKELSLFAETDGSFCCEAEPGRYELEPLVLEKEAALGLKFIPTRHVIEVVNTPVMDIKFMQFRAEIKGKVFCIENCEGLELTLTSLSHNKLPLKAVVGKGNYFAFEKCLPGNYLLSVVKNEWCFQSKNVKFSVADKDVTNLELHQTGYQASVVLTHASTFKVKYPSGAVHDVELHESKNMLCLPETGIYDFIPVGCHLYKKEIFKFDTSSPVELVLLPLKHLVTGSILTELNVTDINVFIKRKESEEEIVSLQEPLDRKENYYRYRFSVFFQPNSDFEIKVTSKQLLFRPSSAIVKVGDDCMENAVEIIGKQGLFLNGSIIPPLRNVNIKVLVKETNEMYTETVTNELGSFLIGPLENESDYEVKAELAGYVFTPLDKSGDFAAFKLAEIVVTVKTEDGKPLAGVLLSLTGGADYRKNSVTQKDGILSFIGLSPGQYFLRSMLKEYNFNPPSKMIDIREGTQVAIEIRGKRVAYSMYGTVSSLTGEAEIGIAVEAVGVDGGACSQYQEEAVSEQGGVFRVRGLQPQCEYVLRLKPGAEVNQHIERSAPNELKLKILDGDITGVRLIVFRYYGQLDISGNVVTPQEYLQNLKVRLYKEGALDQIIHTITLSQSSFFYLPSMPIDNKMYVLQLESSLPSTTYYLEQPSVSFCANTSFYHFTFNFNPRVKSVEQEVTQGSVLALPFTIIVLILIYNYSKLSPLLSQLLFCISSFVNPLKIQPSIDSSIPEASNIRKKTKPKRIQ